MWTRALASADASCGGKAAGLARLVAAGLRVPDGFVIDDRAFRVVTGDVLYQAVLEPDPGISVLLRQAEPEQLGHTLAEIAHRIETTELPDDLVTEVTTRARRLGGPFAVRSSAMIEDGEAGAAAGVFSSRIAVSLDQLWPAIRSVWLSALTPLAAAYARQRERAGGQIAISVIVQRYIEGELMTVYTRPPGAPDANEVWCQRGGVLSKIPRRAGVLVAAETAIDASAGADLELIVPPVEVSSQYEHLGDPGPVETHIENAMWFVQARPIVHPVVKPRAAPPPLVLAPLHDGRRWTLDVTHNPDPLSTAQGDLVDRVERAGAAPWSARVVAGYLYTTPREVPAIEPAKNAQELHARASEIELRIEAVLEDAPTDLAGALDRYVAFIRLWAHELGPLIAASRRAHPIPVDRVSAVESQLLAAAEIGGQGPAVLASFGVLAPAWDVAVPTFAERPGLLQDALARAKAVVQARPQSARKELGTGPHSVNDHARMAAELAEIDDQLFARAQWLVRRGILARADELGIAREDAFWIPLEDLLRGEVDPVDASRRASGARAAAARATSWNMPLVVGGSSTGNSGVALRGIGSGQQVVGRVRRFDSLASAIVVGRGDIVVTRAVTPALAVIVVGCAAIISETGGVLDHGAAMARELGIPCVVGCRDAWSLLADGMIVTIDHDQVTITR